MADDPSNSGGPRPLAYRRPGIGRVPPPYPAVAQAVLGFVAWVVAAGVWVGVCANVRAGSALNAVACVMGGALVTGLIGLCLWLRRRHGWRAFLPGVLVGVGLTCLVPVGLVAIECKPW